jgi:hypothetical protein
MSARIKISQFGLAAGVAGKSRTDGLATGAIVTLEDVLGTGTSTFHLLWVPVEDTAAIASLTVTGDPDIWTFTPMAAAYGSYEIELRVAGVPFERRIFGIRTPANHLLIPALNERASRHANRLNAGADQIELCEQNADDFPLTVLNSFRYAGWWRSLYELYRIVEFGIGSIADNALALIKLAKQPAKTLLANPTNALANVTTLAGTAALQYARVNAANTALEMASLANAQNQNAATTSGSLGVVDISALEVGATLSYQAVTEATIDGFTAKPDGFWFVLYNRDAATSGTITLLENVGNATTSIRTPDIRDLRLYKNDAVMLIYSNSRWHCVVAHHRMFFTGVDAVTWTAQENDHARASRGQNVIRVTLTGNQTLTGVVPDASASGSANGEVLCILNVDTADTLVIAHGSTSSSAINRFALPNNLPILIGPNSNALFEYDDSAQRWKLLGVGGPMPQQNLSLTQTTAQTVTNATTNLTPGSLNAPGNSLYAGAEYLLSALLHTSRGATATAANVIVEILVGGAVVRTLTIPTTTTSGHLGSAKVEARFTCRTTGASGTCMVSLRVDDSISNASATPNGNPLLVRHDPIPATTAAAATTVDTTTDTTLEVRARFDTAVASLAMHMYHATIRRER